MSKKLIILSAVLSLALLSYGYTAVENIKVSGDINAEGVMRDFSFGRTPSDGSTLDAEAFSLTQVRLRFDADLTENVSGTVRLINERLWGAEDNYADNDQIMLDLAYVELKEFLYQPLTLTIGRQLLHYGTGLIVADPDTNATVTSTSLSNVAFGDLSLKKSFDAVKGTLDFEPWSLDLVYAQVREGETNIDDDVRLMGGQLNYKWASFNGLSEGYFWVADNNRNAGYNLVTTQPLENQATTYVVGGRIQFDPIERLTLGLEGAYQFGDVIVGGTKPFQHLSAFAAQAMAEYRFEANYNPKVGLLFSYLSGDDDNTDDDHTGWDQMFEGQAPGEIINILFPNSNSLLVKAYGSIMPREDITLGLAYIWLKLAHNIDSTTYKPWHASAPVVAVSPKETHLGSEIDAYALYDYTEDVQIKLSGAWFIPGDFFASNNDETAYSLRAGIKVNF